jgi:hypothetical protein
MSPTDVEIRWVPGENIYDLFVNGRFRDFYRTFGEAVSGAEKAMEKKDVIEQWKELPPKKGKVRRK